MAIIEDNAALLRQIQELKAQNEALKAKALAKRTVTAKVSEKGAVSVYGLGRWPVTLYRSQWEALFQAIPMVKQFIEDNASELTSKE